MLSHIKRFILIIPAMFAGYGYASDLPVLSQSQYNSCMNDLKGNFAKKGIAKAVFEANRPDLTPPLFARLIISLNFAVMCGIICPRWLMRSEWRTV